MNNREAHSALEFYPVWCFAKAPTYHKWVKLTAADMHRLKTRPGYEGVQQLPDGQTKRQSIYFHLNHPIDWVYLVGTVVAVDHYHRYGSEYLVVLELDDGSGVTIEVKVPYQHGDARDAPERPQDAVDDVQDEDLPNPLLEKSSKPLKRNVYHTKVAGFDIVVTPIETVVTLNDAPIEVGTVIKAKGQITAFGGSHQVELLRAIIVHSLDEEVAYWDDYAAFAGKVLRKPWVLTVSDKAVCEKQRRAREREEEAAKKKEQELKERKRVFEGKAAEREANREKRKETEARMMDGNALDKLGWKPYIPPQPAAEPSEQAAYSVVGSSRVIAHKKTSSGDSASKDDTHTAAQLPATAPPPHPHDSASALLRLLPKNDMLPPPAPSLHTTAQDGRSDSATWVHTPTPTTTTAGEQPTPRFYRPVMKHPATHDGPWFHELKSGNTAYKQPSATKSEAENAS